MQIALGVIIPLYYQLSDYSNDAFIRAFLRDKSGNIIDTVNLTLIDSSGLYGNLTVTMPNTPWIVAKYAAYTDNTYTVLSSSEGGGIDSFGLDTSTIPIQSIVGIVQC